MAVDVVTEMEIRRPRTDVAAFASDPDNAVAWYERIEAVEWRTPRPLVIGSEVAFVARFLGRRLAYTYEVRELVAGERLVMATSEGPFPMETTYTWEDAPGGGTRMILRNRGEPSGFARLSSPLVAAAMRRANRTDLRRLKEILEHRPAGDRSSRRSSTGGTRPASRPCPSRTAPSRRRCSGTSCTTRASRTGTPPSR